MSNVVIKMKQLFIILLCFFSFSGVSKEVELSGKEWKEVQHWMNKTHALVQNQLLVPKGAVKHDVTYELTMDLFGEVAEVTLVNSSGNEELEKNAKHAIMLAQPFDLSSLSENSYERLKVFLITIAPE